MTNYSTSSICYGGKLVSELKNEEKKKYSRPGTVTLHGSVRSCTLECRLRSLIGYVAHTMRDGDHPSCTESTASEDRVQTEPILDWRSIVSLLKNQLNTSSIENSLSEFSSASHQAGSSGDDVLGEKVWKKFMDYGMKPWTDSHIVRLHVGPTNSTNTVMFRNKTFPEPGFLAYSPTGRAQGAVLYAHYGQTEDFKSLQDLNISSDGKIVLIRAGKISFAEKVHLGSGDPFSPGFPSLNHTQYPPAKSSGLPSIPAQTISASTAAAIMRKMGGHDPPHEWAGGGLRNVTYKLGGDDDVASVEVNDNLRLTKIFNMFGVIKGFVDPDRFVVVGAQRDAWGPGFAKSTVGTSLLLELARGITEMMNKMTLARVCIRKWLERTGRRLCMYINWYCSSVVNTLDSGSEGHRSNPSITKLPRVPERGPQAKPLSRNCSVNKQYPFFGTMLDTRENLEAQMSTGMLVMVKAAGEMAGVMVLRLVHDHLLSLNVEKYKNVMRIHVGKINKEVMRLEKFSHLTEHVQTQWLTSALGSYIRASNRLITSIQNSDLDDLEQCRIINDQIMGVERNLLSPYVSPRDTPFRHILLGSGSHTLGAVFTHLASIHNGTASVDAVLLNNQIAAAAWMIQSCAGALAGNVWDAENDLD
ncbi:transferrin receptor protein 1 [Silurus asotus]|uniref:Transferrin receptor protein 1 n=1 Tax=Silurus asotus TaxID=30991 RepID=A0AAD5A318_SILAS|nr:transferrin receptor protein 1 [Silurus asotus]